MKVLNIFHQGSHPPLIVSSRSTLATTTMPDVQIQLFNQIAHVAQDTAHCRHIL